MIVLGELAGTTSEDDKMIWVRSFHADNARHIGYLVARADDDPPLAIHALFNDGQIDNSTMRCELSPDEDPIHAVLSRRRSSIIIMESLGLRHPTYLPRDD